MKGYLPWVLPALLGTTATIIVSGLLLAPGTFVTRAEMELFWMLPPPGRLTAAALHAIAGFALMLLVGALWSIHMRAGWRKRLHRGSGLSLALSMPFLALSAVGVYYFGNETLAATAAFVHLGLGVLMALMFAWHWTVRKQ